MNLLLDTNALLWWMEGSTKLGSMARGAIESRDGTVWVSAATTREIAIKSALRRLSTREAPDVFLPREIERSRFQPLPITIRHGLAVMSLPHHHRDPFDRMLVAQARLEGLTVVTSDPMFRRYDVAILDASA